jgi:hypothetical protein
VNAITGAGQGNETLVGALVGIALMALGFGGARLVSNSRRRAVGSSA